MKRNKPWYKQKTFWAGLVLVLTGVSEMISEGGVTNHGLETIVQGVGLIFLRFGVEKAIL